MPANQSSVMIQAVVSSWYVTTEFICEPNSRNVLCTASADTASAVASFALLFKLSVELFGVKEAVFESSAKDEGRDRVFEDMDADRWCCDVFGNRHGFSFR